MIEGGNSIITTCLSCGSCRLSTDRVGHVALDDVKYRWCNPCNTWMTFRVHHEPEVIAAFRLGGQKAVEELISAR